MRKYILISNELSLEIDDDNLYINGEIYKTKDDEDFREIAINKKREYYKKKLEKLLLSDNLLLALKQISLLLETLPELLKLKTTLLKLEIK